MVENNWSPRLTINEEAILKLFTGETFYSSYDAAIREAVLNAIDAIGRRQDTEPNITPDIQVIFDRQSMTVTVMDNGDGMGKREIESLFAKIGESASQAINSVQGGHYKAIGEFGIGILSYFLVCERFQLHSKKKDDKSIGLEFSRAMLDAKTPASVINSRRNEQGTELVLSIEKEEYFDLVLKEFPKWVREVSGLKARLFPEDEEIPQGGLSREIKPVPVDKPDWIHEAHIGPPVLFDSWDRFDGFARVDVLYRGIFVDTYEIPHLWAISGAIHVDPKRFRPKLNREGFVGDKLQAALEPVLRACHPKVLERAVDCVREVLTEKNTKHWSLHRWVTLWLAVPRSGEYQNVAQIWDAEFQHRKAFKLLSSGRTDKEVSISDIQNLGQEKIYVVPEDLSNKNQITQQAVRILRDSGHPLIQGIGKEKNFLRNTSFVSASTGDLLVKHFQHVLPELVHVESVAAKVIKQETAINVFDEPPEVKLVKIGTGAVPVLPVGEEVWINIDNEAGKRIVEDICKRNEGHLGFWIACLQYGELQNSRDYAQQIARILKKSRMEVKKLAPITRQYLRGVLR